MADVPRTHDGDDTAETNDQPSLITHERRGFVGRLLGRRADGQEENLRSLREAVTIEEVVALIHYVSERGLDPNSEIIGPLHSALVTHEQKREPVDKIGATKEILTGYTKLCALTFPEQQVNGRTLRNTAHSAWHMGWIISWGILFFLAALSIEIVGEWFSDVKDFGSLAPWQLHLVEIQKIASEKLIPLIYGGLGACIYLLRTLSDKAANGTFDSRKLQGAGARIFLGAVFGFIVVNLFYEAPIPGSDELQTTFGFQNLQQGSVAFLSGLGVKAIYGAFEKAVDFIHSQIQGIGQANDQKPQSPPPQGRSEEPGSEERPR